MEKERRARVIAVAILVGNEGYNLVPCQWNGGIVACLGWNVASLGVSLRHR